MELGDWHGTGTSLVWNRDDWYRTGTSLVWNWDDWYRTGTSLVWNQQYRVCTLEGTHLLTTTKMYNL